MRYRKPSDQCKNLYRFIRLILGEDISDREIARRWGMDEKNLRELKKGLRVVPKLSRLESLAQVLGVRKYYVL
jgi:transcriptional regulator with XRE-family HTH domain